MQVDSSTLTHEAETTRENQGQLNNCMMSTRTRRSARRQNDERLTDDGLSDRDEHTADEQPSDFHPEDETDGDAPGEDEGTQDEMNVAGLFVDTAGEQEPAERVRPGGEEQNNVTPPGTPAPAPPAAPARRVTIAEPQRRERTRRTIRHRRARSSDSDEYQTGEEAPVQGDDRLRARRPMTLNVTQVPRQRRYPEHGSGDRIHGEVSRSYVRPRNHLHPEFERDDEGRAVVYVSTATEVPPPQVYDPTLFFSERVKRDSRYGVAAAKALAQMALRDGKDDDGAAPEPELIAYNLKLMNAGHLIAHRPPPGSPDDQWLNTESPMPRQVADVEQSRPAGNQSARVNMATGPAGDVLYRPPMRTAADHHMKESRSAMALRIPTYEGGNWAAFRQQFEKVAAYNGWDDEQKATQLHINVQGKAADALGVEDSANWSYDKLIAHLEKRHGRHRTYAQVLTEVCKYYMKADMTLPQWHDQVIRVANTASLTPEQYKQVTYQGYTMGLRSFPALQTYVLNKDTERTISSAARLADEFERENGASAYVHPSLTAGDALVRTTIAESPAETEDVSKLMSMIADLQAKVESQSKKNNRAKKNTSQATASNAQQQQSTDAGAADNVSEGGDSQAGGKKKNRRGKGKGKGKESKNNQAPPQWMTEQWQQNVADTQAWFTQQGQDTRKQQQYQQQPQFCQPMMQPPIQFVPYYQTPQMPSTSQGANNARPAASSADSATAANSTSNSN